MVCGQTRRAAHIGLVEEGASRSEAARLHGGERRRPRGHELRDEAAATLSRRRAALDARVERDVENLRRDLADREAALSRRRADIKREMDALVLKYEACATEACGAREAFQRAAESARAAAAEEASQYQRQADDAIRARLEREAKQLGFKMSASPRPRD